MPPAETSEEEEIGQRLSRRSARPGAADRWSQLSRLLVTKLPPCAVI